MKDYKKQDKCSSIYGYLSPFNFKYSYDLKGFILDEEHVGFVDDFSITVINLNDPKLEIFYEIPDSLPASYYCDFTKEWLSELSFDDFIDKCLSTLKWQPSGFSIDFNLFFEALKYETVLGDLFIANQFAYAKYEGGKLTMFIEDIKLYSIDIPWVEVELICPMVVAAYNINSIDWVDFINFYLFLRKQKIEECGLNLSNRLN